MKSYHVIFLNFVMFVSFADTLGNVIIENATPYAANVVVRQIVYSNSDRIGSLTKIPRESSVGTVHSLIIPAQQTIAFEQQMQRLVFYTVTINEEPVAIQQEWEDFLQKTGVLILSIVPWGKSYRLIRLIQ